MLPFGLVFRKGYYNNHDNSTISCFNFDKKTVILSLFLLNSLVLSTYGLFLELEWQKRMLFIDDLCSWKTDILEFLICKLTFFLAFFFFVISTTVLMFVDYR